MIVYGFVLCGLLIAWIPIRALRWVSDFVRPTAASETVTVGRSRLWRRLDQFMLWCAAVPDPRDTNRAFVEHRRDMVVSLSVILTAGTAASAMVLFLRLIMPGIWLRDLVLGLFWGLLVLGVDRRMVSATTLRNPDDGHQLGQIAVALALAALISGQLLIGLFEPEIDREVSVAQEVQRVAVATQIRQRADFVDRRAKTQAALNAAETTEREKNQAVAAAQTALEEEISGRGGSRVPGAGPLSRDKRVALDAAKADADAARTAAAAARTKAQADTAALNADITAAINKKNAVVNDISLARQQEFLDALAAYPVFWIRWIVVTGILLLGDLLPLLRTGRTRTQVLGPKFITISTTAIDSARSEGNKRPTNQHIGPDRRDLPRPTAQSTASTDYPRVGKSSTVPSSAVGPHPVTFPDWGQRCMPAPSTEPLVTPAVPATTTIDVSSQGDPTQQPAVSEQTPEIALTLAWLNAVKGVEGNYLLGLTVNKIGRSSTADIVVPRATVSRHHCTINNDGNRLLLVAEPSPNGTYINQDRIPAGRPVELRNRDIIGLGTNIKLEVFVPKTGQQTTRLKFRFAGETEAGGRISNEDAFHISDQVVAVADGVGGRPAGGIAAVLAVQGLKGVRGTADLSRAVHAVNAKVRGQGVADPLTSGLAATLDAAVLSAEGGTPWVHGIHVGDGMALLQRPRRVEVVWLTRAHTLAATIHAASPNAITAGDAEHPQGGRLMRAVGFAEEIQADEWQEQAEEGQRYLLASDGLFHALGEGGLRRATAELRTADPRTCAKGLVRRALEAGADDNVTVVVADVVTQ